MKKHYPLVLGIVISVLFTGCGFNSNTDQTYTLTYYSNGADTGSVPNPVEFSPNETIVASDNVGALSKANYIFSGWSTSSDSLWIDYEPGDNIYTLNNDISLYAQWEEKPSYNVLYRSYDSTGGYTPYDGNSYYEGETVTVLGNTNSLYRTGYTFIGWNTEYDSSGIDYAEGDEFTMGTEDVYLFADWTTAPTYNVTYHADDAESGTVPVDSKNYLEDAYVTVKSNTGCLIRSGYSLSGWNTDEYGNGTDYTPGQKFSMGTEDVDLYAKWSLPVGVVTINNPDSPSFALEPASFVLQIGGGITQQTVSITAGSGITISSYIWQINGISQGSGSSIILNTETNSDWFINGQNTLTLIIVIDDMPYSDSFIFTVEQY